MSHSEKFVKKVNATEKQIELEKRLNRLEEAFDHNTALFSDTLAELDLRYRLALRALNDMVAGKARVVGVGESSKFDWEYYYDVCSKELEDMLVKTDNAPAPNDSSDIPEGAVVFGGDSGKDH